MASRFEKVDDEFIEELKKMSENENTKKSTDYWAIERNVNTNLEEYECDALDQMLSQFYAELRKENGDDYEPDPLKVMQAAMERYLKSKSYAKSIIRDREFINSRKVLEGKARKLREQGKGKRPNRSKRLTKEEEEVLRQNGQLGSGTPRALINTMWWLITQHFGLRGRQEHHQMKVEDFTVQRDDDGTEFLTFDEGLTKTRQGGLSVKNRLVTPKMFATGHEERCPVMLFKLYLEKCPKRNENERSVLPFNNRQARFKHLVQENTNGQKHYKHYHEKNERILTSEGTLSTKEDHQSQCQENHCQEAEKFRRPKVRNKEYYRPRFGSRTRRLRLWRRARTANDFKNH